jgi:hypothetical protein
MSREIPDSLGRCCNRTPHPLVRRWAEHDRRLLAESTRVELAQAPFIVELFNVAVG